MSDPATDPKPPRKARKRRVAANDSCVRTDLLELRPNRAKKEALDRLFEATSEANDWMMERQWRALLAGKRESTSLWKELPEGYALHGNSVLLQPLAASVAGCLDGHLGWLSRDFADRVLQSFRRLFRRIAGSSLPDADREALASKWALARHELLAVNRAKAWVLRDSDARGAVKRRDGTKLVPVSDQAFDRARRIFLKVSAGRRLPDASLVQGEQTRASARLSGTAELTGPMISLLGMSLEEAKSSSFPWWLKTGTPEGPLVVPAPFHRGLALRNAGDPAPGANASGPEGHPTRKTRRADRAQNPSRQGRHKRELRANRLNPSGLKPEKVESVGLIRSISPTGETSYKAAVRSQMKDCFEKTKAQHLPAMGALSVDFGIRNFLTLSHPLGGVRRHGESFLKDKVMPVLAKIEAMRAKLQADDGQRRLRLAQGDAEAAKDLPRGPASSKRIRRLETRAEGLVETFLGTLFNRISSELRPSCLIVEELDFRGQDLSPGLNRLLANCGRAFLDRKLKDLHEKTGVEVVRVLPHYTSQECPDCHHVDADNRKGDLFKCLRCGREDHADQNASESIGKRRPLPGASKRLVKKRGAFAWETQGALPFVPEEEWDKVKGRRHPRLFWALLLRHREWVGRRPPDENTAGAPAEAARAT